MNGPAGHGPLPDEDWDQLLAIAERFEEAWQDGNGVDLASFLPPPGTALRAAVLHELIQTEFEIRCRRRQNVALEDYLTRFPELGAAKALPAKLIYEEYRVRTLHGDRPPVESYRTRFPHQFEELQRLLRAQPIRPPPGPPPAPSPPSSASETAASGTQRTEVLDGLIKADLESRARDGKTVALEDYLKRFPELGGADKLSVALIYEEYRVRMLFGDRPPLDDYHKRFPCQFEEFYRLLSEKPIRAPVVGALGRVLPPSEGYRLMERIGAGQYGEVFRARGPGDVEVAVKRIFRALNDEASQRELQALELIRTLRHPFLLRTERYWALKDRVVMVMELADDSLADWFQACKDRGHAGIPAAELIAYLHEAAEALDYMHAKSVLHRDVKPGNLLRLQGHAKVADFGLARLQESQVMTVTFCGTPLYMAPEVWRGKISVHSDQYSLAVTYCEMRLGRRPFPSSDPTELGQQHLHDKPNLKGAGHRETAVLLRALHKSPDERYPSCKAFVEALATATAPPPPAPERFPWALIVVGAALFVLLGAIAAALLLPRGEGKSVAPPSGQAGQP